MYKSTTEDLGVYKECFLNLLADDNVKILKIVNGYLDVILLNYLNNHNSNPLKSPKSAEDKKDDCPF